MNYKKRNGSGPLWQSLSEPSQKWPVVGFILIVLFISSCHPTRQIVQSERQVRDSVVIKEIQSVTPVTIPASRVELTIPTANLRNLPQGAAYIGKQGQAGVEVRYEAPPGEPENILVTATCDSLQILCWELERELIRTRDDTEKEKTEIIQDAARAKNRCLVIGFICGLCVSLTITWLGKKVKRIFKI